MDRETLDKKLQLHIKWIKNEEGGECADLQGANLSDANLSDANLINANLSDANLSGADLSGADLSYAKLRDADLSGANLSGANMRGADLGGANLSGANLSGADLSGANLSGADLSYAKLSGADLSYAKLRDADLSGANNLLSPIDYIEQNFEKTADGIIVYKTFGLHYTPPETWKIAPSAIIEEVVNFDLTIDCACGVNVGTKEWIDRESHGTVWKCLIRWEWLVGVCVPFATDGKIRASKVQLLETVAK